MVPHVWLIPCRSVPRQLRLFIGALSKENLDYSILPVGEMHEQPQPPADLAVLHGGPTSPELLDCLRALMRLQVPTMVLVAGLSDRLESLLLDRGAQDVLALPAAPELIRSRLNAFGRVHGLGRPTARRSSTLRVLDDIEVHPDRRAVFVAGRGVDLTKTEFDLLLQVSRHPGRVLTREDLARTAAPVPLTARALESHMSRLRIKLLRAGSRNHLRAVRGVGYRWINGSRSRNARGPVNYP